MRHGDSGRALLNAVAVQQRDGHVAGAVMAFHHGDFYDVLRRIIDEVPVAVPPDVGGAFAGHDAPGEDVDDLHLIGGKVHFQPHEGEIPHVEGA